MTSCLGTTNYVVNIGELDPVGSENDAEVFLNAEDLGRLRKLHSMDEKRVG